MQEVGLVLPLLVLVRTLILVWVILSATHDHAVLHQTYEPSTTDADAVLSIA
jgi:hypothetical protein